MLSFQALSRMREYERLRTEGKLSELVASQSAARYKLIKDDVTTSSAGDVGSESSISDVQVSHAFWRTTAHGEYLVLYPARSEGYFQLVLGIVK